MGTIAFSSEGQKRLSLSHLLLIILVLVAGIASTWLICEFLVRLLISNDELNALQQNYPGH